MYTIYTDGAYSPSNNQGGIGFIIVKDEQEVFRYSKMYKNTTNNRMEMLACIVALESFKKPASICIVSDSMYVVGTMTKNWKRKKNADLWERFDKAVSRHIDVKFEWCKGHAGNAINNQVDELAFNASKLLA